MRAFKLIRWIWDGKSGTSAAIQTFITQILILAVTLVTSVTTARFLGPVGRGEQAAVLLWPNFLGFLFSLGIGSSLLFHLRRSPEEESELFSAAMVLAASFGGVAALVGIVFMPQWMSQYSLTTIRVAQGFMLTAPISLFSTVLLKTFQAQFDFSTANKATYLQPFLTLLLLIGLCLAGVITPLTSAFAYRIPVIVITAWLLIKLWKYYKPNFKNFRSSCQKILSYSTRSAGINIFNQMAERIDQAMVVSLLSPSAMGIYAVSLKLSRMVAPFNKSLLTVLFPKMTARPPKEVIALTAKAARISCFLTTVTAVAASLLAPVILTGLYGADFSSGVYAFRILVIRMVLEGSTMVLAQAFMALDRPGVVTILQGIGLGATVPLMLILVPSLGMTGASYALLISTAIRLGFIMICFPTLLKSPMPNLMIQIEDIVFIRHAIKARTVVS